MRGFSLDNPVVVFPCGATAGNMCVCVCVCLLMRVCDLAVEQKKIDEATDLAFKLEKKGDLKGAVKQWDVVISVYETGGDGVVLTPQALYRLGKSFGERANALAELGKQRKKGEFIELAVEDYRKSLSLVPSNDNRLKLASALSAVGKYQEADKEFGEVLKEGVSNEVKGRAFNNRGLARERLGNWEGAVGDFTEAVEVGCYSHHCPKRFLSPSHAPQ